MGKSDSLLDVIGERLDTAPVPMLYVGPTKQMLTEQWEPRVMQLLDEAASLRKKVTRGKRMTKTKKIISGVPFRLAHAGSSAALKSDPFGLALTDEADELMANVKGQGNPIELIDMRGQTYADFVHAIVSTPSSRDRLNAEHRPVRSGSRRRKRVGVLVGCRSERSRVDYLEAMAFRHPASLVVAVSALRRVFHSALSLPGMGEAERLDRQGSPVDAGACGEDGVFGLPAQRLRHH